MTTQHIFRLGFISDQGNDIKINLPMANTSITQESVRAAMDAIISSGVVRVHDETPVSRKSARIATHTITDFEIIRQ